MERQFIIDNNRERDRLKKLISKLTDEELKSVIYKEGWTIATALAHLAFWDQFALGILRKWKKNGVTTEPSIDVDVLNDALFRLFLDLPPRMLAKLAETSADSVDQMVAESADDFIQEIEASKEPPYRLNRGFHRKMHLDEIEAFLKKKAKKS